MVWRGDVAVAGDSDSSYNTSIFFNRRVGQKGNKAVMLGYRYFVDDYNNEGTYAWDVTESGPLAGFSWNLQEKHTPKFQKQTELSGLTRSI